MSGKTTNEFKASLFMSGLNCILLSQHIHSGSQTDPLYTQSSYFLILKL